MGQKGEVIFLRSFSFSNFDAKRCQKLVEDIKAMALVKMGIAGVLFLINPFLGIWLGTAGLMLGGFAGGVRLSYAISQHNFRAKNTGVRAQIIRSMHVHNHARDYRRGASSTAIAGGGSDDSDGGSDPDSSDPPGPNLSFLVTPFHNSSLKPNSFLSPWRLGYVLDCWRLLCHLCSAKGVSA